MTKEGNKNGRSGKGKSLKYEYDYDDDFIRITSPKEGAVYYRGETMTVGFSAYSTWVEYDTVSVAGIFRTTDSTMFYRDSIYIYNDDLSWHSSSGKYNTSKLSNGSYTVDVFNFAYDPYYDELYDFDNMPYQYNTFTVKTLKAPGSLKTKVGKKKVKLTFAKASGATKYEIYRSTKKNKGFKKIATVSGNTYKDKKVKRKKIYYYKVNKGMMKEAIEREKFRMNAVDVLTCSSNLEDLDEIEDWPAFLKALAVAGGYQKIILDMGEAMRNLEEAFDMCSGIYIPHLGSEEDEKWMSELKMFFLERGREDLLEKVNVIS